MKKMIQDEEDKLRPNLPNSLYSSKRSLTIDNFQSLYKMSSPMNRPAGNVANVPANASVANVPSNVPVRTVAPTAASAPSNVAMVGNVAHVPANASVANIPSNVRVNVVPSNAMLSNANRNNMPPPVNSASLPRSNFSSTAMTNNLPSGCPLSPPVGEVNYCRPAPFQSSTGEKYFRVSEAYGAPIAS